MRLWDLRPAASASVSAMFEGEALLDAFRMQGINPNAVRLAIARVSVSHPTLRIIDLKGNSVACEAKEVPDIVFCGWIPVFSSRAKELCVQLGGAEDDFWPCEFQGIQPGPFFMHVPAESYDILDMEQSRFGMLIPLKPPLPHNIELAKLRSDMPDLPPCFRIAIPGHSQVLGELIVTDVFKCGWEQAGLQGGNFRRLN